MSAETVHCLVAVWLFALGGAIGSFLNVVIYRLPRGIGLSRPGSHCPACKRPIRWHDNVPMVGWLVLAGRCRDCRWPISPRYPAVEAVTAALFLILGLTEFLFGGANLPLRAAEPAEAATSAELGGICAYHLLLLCTLLAAILIEADGHRPPVRVFVPALVVGILAPLAWRHLHPVAAWTVPDGWIGGLADGVAGLTAGVLLGWLGSQVCVPKRKTGMLLGLACAGLFLGWQAVLVLASATLAVHLLLRGLGRRLPAMRQIPPTAWLTAATLAWILAWSRLVAIWPALISHST